MTYNWNQIGITEITNLYLYGQLTAPTDKMNEFLIRPKDVEGPNGPKYGAIITVDMASYMETGPGRFALGSESALVQTFFTADPSWMEAGRIYTKQEIFTKFNFITLDDQKNAEQINIKQSLLDDLSGDYWERSYIWNSGLFKIADDVTFSIDANGNRTIHNYTVRAFDDDFDYVGGNLLADFGNAYLEPRIDPWNIGRAVEIRIRDDNAPLPPREYTSADYSADSTSHALHLAAGTAKVLTLPVAADEILTQLWNEGATKLLHEGKPIIYGTVEADILSASDLPSLSVSSHLYLYSLRYPTTGVVLVSGDGDDTITGGNYADKLLGGIGNDILIGGKGNDYLEGGTGMDTYIFNQGDGFNTVFDVDGLGVIQFGSVAALGRNGVVDGRDWLRIGESWVDRQNGLSYLLVAQGGGSNDLLIKSVSGSGVRIKTWDDGKLGITLGENVLPDTPVSDLTITGDLQPVDPPEIDALGNVVVGTEEAPDREDVLFGSSGNDLIQSLGGNDKVLGKDGADWIEGGSGQDILEGGAGDDVVLGGEDSDIIMGHQDNDRLYAETEYTLDAAYSLGETQAASGQRGDLMDGGAGADILIGEAGDDILMGGMGKDVLMGLGGNDTIEGDYSVGTTDRNWSVTRTINTAGATTLYNRSYNFDLIETDGGAGDDDVIYGGAGNDWIFAQGGHDFVDAGADDDVVFGGAGNDFILGQGGHDVLLGDDVSLDASLHGDDYLNGGDGNDWLWGEGGSDYLEGGAGNDILFGDGNYIPAQYQGDDWLDGGAGDDWLFGGNGNDTLIGGPGADRLYGGAGDDTYIDVDAGDVIVDLEGRNTILLANANGVSTNTTSPRVTWSSNSVLHIALDNDTTLDLESALYGTNAYVNFSNGSGFDLESWVGENLHDAVVLNLQSATTDYGQAPTYAYGGAGADLIQGSAGNDTLKGYGGNDYLLGRSGNDLIAGGAGDDVLFGEGGDDILQGGLGADRYIGGSGADVYIFERGDGADTITVADASDAVGDEVHMGADIAASDLRFFQLASGSLLMRINGTQDSILFEDWFTEGPNVAAVRLHDDSLISASEMSMLAVDSFTGTDGDDVLIGTAAADLINGYAGNDILDGRGGNDTLVGGDGIDTYLFGWTSQGDDVVVESPVGTSVISLTADTALTDLRHEQVQDDLILTLRGGGATLTLKDFYVSTHVWMIREENDAVIDISDWLVLPEPVVDIAQLQADFLAAARAEWANDLLNNTYSSYYGLYTQMDSTTYRAELATTYDKNILIERFKLVENIDDSAFIERQSDMYDSSYTRIDLLDTSPGNPPVTDPSAGQKFIPLNEWIQQMDEAGLAGVGGLIPVYGNGGIIGFLTSPTPTAPGTIRSYSQNTIVNDTQVEHIQGGDSDNVIMGYKFGNGFGYLNYDLPGEISIIDGGSGNDILYASGKISLSYEMFYFADTASHLGGFVYGNTGDDILYGGYYRDTLVGGDGNDFLDGGFSQDTYIMLAGESGIDTIWDTGTQLWQITNFYRDAISSYLYLGEKMEPELIAQDTLRLVGINQNDIIFTWGQRVAEGIRDPAQGTADEFANAFYTQTMHATLTLLWTGGGVEIVLPNSTDLPGMGLERIQFGDGTVLTIEELIALADPAADLNPQDQDNVIISQGEHNVIFGEGGNDTLTGGAGDDYLDGGIGDDILIGGAGNDTLFGDTGNDILIGGEGDDIYLFGRGSGQDTIDSYDTTSGKIDTVIFDYDVAEDDIHVNRSGNDLILTIIGTNDSLTILNYLENDGVTPYSVEEIRFSWDYIVWNLATVKTKLEGNQAPELLTALPDQAATEGEVFSYTFDVDAFVDPDAGDWLTYSATLADGSVLPSWLSFDASTRTFSGVPDMLGIVSVRVTATDSSDLTVSDIFDIVVGEVGMTISGTSGADILEGGTGNDILNGLAGNDILIGNAGSDRLNGGKGNDTMIGGTGDDIYVVDNGLDVVIENFDEGIDTVRSSITYILGANVENLNLTGTAAIDGTGNELDNRLVGNSASNTLIGGAGNDRLDGKEGADILIGGSGDDIYIVDDSEDVVIELSNEGIDRVRSSVSYTLSANVEELVLTGSLAIDGTGNELDNRLVGNSVSNTLIGGAGNDRLDSKEGADILIGGSGDDIYIVDDSEDVVIELSNEGIDRVRSSVSYTLSANVEELVLTGSLAIDGIGNELDNRLVGNDADNALYGGIGKDILNGRGGDDILIGGEGNDVYIMGHGYGVETIVENDATVGNMDAVRFLPGISTGQIWFQRMDDNLEISIIGTSDKLVVNNWYLDSAYQIEQFRTADGMTLYNSQVDGLVDAMANFAPLGIGEITMPMDYAQVLDPVITALWL